MEGEERRSRMRVGVAIGVVAFVLICVWLWIARRHVRSGGVGVATDPDSVSESADAAGTEPRGSANPVSQGDASETDASSGRSLDHTVRDRVMHDDVRARILAAWSAARSAAPDAGSGGAAIDRGPPGGHLDAAYIRSLIRDEFLPMARDCYDQQIARADAAAGRMTLQFVIMADEHAGGIVDDVQSDAADGGSFDDAFGTCMRETMRTMVFRAPEGGGRITVRYPFVFAQGDGG